MVNEKAASEELMTAASQNWVVAIRTPGGYAQRLERVVVVQAQSEAMAIDIAINKVRRGKWKHLRKWEITKVENVDNNNGGEEHVEPSDSSGS